jgi:broad specificity phosphatase PhoE
MPDDKPIAFLVRHGETVARDRKIFISWIDFPLDTEGEQQAKDAIDFLSDYEIKTVYSSPLQRAVYGALLLNKPVQQDRGLLPWNRGILTGISEEDGNDALKLFLDNPSVAIPYGESRTACEKRLTEFFTPALERSESTTTAFFTHHSVIDVLNCLLTGERTKEPKNLVKTGGVVAVYIDGDGYRLEPVLRPDNDNSGLS